MYSKFDYIKMDPKYYFSSKRVRFFFFFARLLEIKKNIEGVKSRF
jgi:hypothetical protein